MQLKLFRNEWQKTIWKLVSNPTLDVMAAIVAVLLATWFVVTTEVERRDALQIPFLFNHK